MRFRLLHLLLVIGLILPAVAAAQTGADRVQSEIDRTEQRIVRAQGLVAGSGNATAKAQVDQAVQIQANARATLAQGRPGLALDLTLRARAAADRAIAIINGLPDPERVLSQLQRTREMLDRARGRIEECNDDRARALLSTASEMQGRAEEAARGGHYLAALQLTMGARERVLRALRRCNAEDDSHDGAERALGRTDEIIQRAQDSLGNNPPARASELLSRATEIQARARAQFRDQHFESSLRLTLSARAFALRAARAAGRAR
jgi:hypothetical protein